MSPLLSGVCVRDHETCAVDMPVGISLIEGLTITSRQASAVRRYTAARYDTEETNGQAGEQDISDHESKGDGVPMLQTPTAGMLDQ